MEKRNLNGGTAAQLSANCEYAIADMIMINFGWSSNICEL
jgi:hypothetical protein